MLNIKNFSLTLLGILLLADPAFAADAAAGAGNSGAYVAVGAAIGIAIAAFAGTMSQGKVASAALDGIARNPGASGQMFLPMILGLVFIESLVLFVFALPIALKLFGIF